MRAESIVYDLLMSLACSGVRNMKIFFRSHPGRSRDRGLWAQSLSVNDIDLFRGECNEQLPSTCSNKNLVVCYGGAIRELDCLCGHINPYSLEE